MRAHLFPGSPLSVQTHRVFGNKGLEPKRPWRKASCSYRVILPMSVELWGPAGGGGSLQAPRNAVGLAASQRVQILPLQIPLQQ